MRKRGKKQKSWLGKLTGLAATAAALLASLCLLACLIQTGRLSEKALQPLLAAACLLSAIAGCAMCKGGEGKLLEQLLSGVVPAFAVLCCGICLSGGDGIGKWALWNAAILLIPCLVAQLFPESRKRKRKR